MNRWHEKLMAYPGMEETVKMYQVMLQIALAPPGYFTLVW